MELISLIIFIVIAAASFFLFNGELSLRYKHWYRPLLLTMLIILSLTFISKIIDLLVSLIAWEPLFLEIIFASIVGILWILIKFLLRKFKIDDVFLDLLKKINKDSYDEKLKGESDYLLWPYYINPPTQILRKAGSGLYRLMFITLAILTGLLYLVGLYFRKDLPISFETGIGVFPILIFIEYFIYLSSDKEINEEVKEPPVIQHKTSVDYDKLWNRFVSTFPTSFSTAFIKFNEVKKNEVNEINEEMIKSLVEKFSLSGCDIIATNLDLTESLHKFSSILFKSIGSGGNILILVEIPIHFKADPTDFGFVSTSGTKEWDLAEIFTLYLSREMQKQISADSEILKIFYYNAREVADSEKHRILMTSVNNMLSDKLLGSQWIKNLELLVVINFQDSCLSTISEDRQFSLLLEGLNPGYKTLIFSPFRNEIHAGLEHTWLLDKVEERKFADQTNASKSYFIGFNFERWRDNWNAVAKPLTGNPISSGLELAILPLAEKVPHVHLLETAYSEAREGREDLAVHEEKVNRVIADFTKNEILNGVYVNLLPVPVFGNKSCSMLDEQHLSIIYDSENNTPKLYNKYKYLGQEQNFTIILTKPHLFREYFADNMLYFIQSPIEAIQPQLSKSRINLSIQLLVLLRKQKVSKERIIELLHQYGITEYISIPEELFILFRQYFNYNIRDNFALGYECHEIFHEGNYRLEELFFLNKNAREDSTGFSFLNSVTVVDNASNELFDISLNLLFQNFLPGQTMALNGRPYLFENFSHKDLKLQVRKTESRNTLFYKPVHQVTLSGEVNEADKEETLMFFRQGNGYKLSLAMKEMTAIIETHAYFEFISAYNSPQAGEMQPVQYDLKHAEQKMVKREYTMCRILTLNWELLPDFVKDKAEITTWLHILLSESLKVFFPLYNQYLIIVSDNSFNTSLRRKLPWIFPESDRTSPPLSEPYGQAVSINILEDSFADLGLLKAIQRNFIYIQKHVFDLLLWYGEEPLTNQANLMNYRNNIKDKLTYLSYGLTEQPGFDKDLMIRFLEHHLPIDKTILYEISAKRKLVIIEGSVECDYCHQPYTMDKITTMEDGLHRCNECSIDAIDTLEQALVILEEAKELYRDHLSIDFNKYSFDFHFVTAKELHELNNIEFVPTSKYDVRKLVGQAWDDNKDRVYIEKGYKHIQTLDPIIHELCHIWEYNELDCAAINSDPIKADIIEGMCIWAEVFLLRKAGFGEYADYLESAWQNDTTKYGNGYRYLKENYPTDPLNEIKREFKIRK